MSGSGAPPALDAALLEKPDLPHLVSLAEELAERVQVQSLPSCFVFDDSGVAVTIQPAGPSRHQLTITLGPLPFTAEDPQRRAILLQFIAFAHSRLHQTQLAWDQQGWLVMASPPFITPQEPAAWCLAILPILQETRPWLRALARLLEPQH